MYFCMEGSTLTGSDFNARKLSTMTPKGFASALIQHFGGGSWWDVHRSGTLPTNEFSGGVCSTMRHW